MGFFKKIGQGIKKAAKQISLKNIIKIGGMVDPSGIVSGLQNAHYENKSAKEAEAQNQAEEAEYFAQLSKTSATKAGAAIVEQASKTTVLSGVLGGAVGAAGGKVVDESIKGYFALYKKQILIGLGVVAALVLYKFKDKLFGKAKKKSRFS